MIGDERELILAPARIFDDALVRAIDRTDRRAGRHEPTSVADLVAAGGCRVRLLSMHSRR